MRLTHLDRNRPAYVDSVDWSALSDADGKRLRELGLCEGASIELLHRAGFLGWLANGIGFKRWPRHGAHSCRVGRMTVAMRASHAAAIAVRTGPAPANGVDPEA